jgi:sugar phosphate isomerase/epimerase
MKYWIPLAAVLLVFMSVARSADDAPSRAKAGVFSRNNLVAWCIVPFDAKHRGPKERAEMLSRLGVKRIAYDWRDNNIPEWDEELAQYKAHNIELVGFWAPDRHRQILDLLKRHGIKSQLWLMSDGKGDTQARRVESAAAAVAPVAKLAQEYGCTVGLYNHGGWFGEPDNQIAIIDRLRQDGIRNVGIVYNLHHGHGHLDRFPELLERMKPHLLCLNLNGMKKGGPKILAVGQGDGDLAILQAIRASGYAGPIGVLNHREEMDAEVALRENVEGLKSLLKKLGDDASLKTYAE